MISEADKVGKTFEKWLKHPHKRFGNAKDSRREQACKEFDAYLLCRGHLTTDKIHVTLPEGSTAEDATKAFGRPLRQQRILNEEEYAIQPSQPLWRFSNNCKVSLIFAYGRDEEIQALQNGGQAALGATTKLTGRLWNGMKRNLSGGSSNTGTETDGKQGNDS